MESTAIREEYISKVCDLWVEGFDLFQCKVSDDNPTPEKMKLLQYSLKNQGKEYTIQWVKDYVLKHLDVDSCGFIKWQKGIPSEIGTYLITTFEGTVASIHFRLAEAVDVDFFKTCVIAWCKLSDIEPYKEE